MRFNHLDADLFFERFLVFMVRQAPAWLNADERIEIAPNSKEWRFRKVNLDLPPFFQVLKFDDVFIDIGCGTGRVLCLAVDGCSN